MASPYLLQATDGTDLGANIATVVALTNVAVSGDRRTITETRYGGASQFLTYTSVQRVQYPRTLLDTDTFPTRAGMTVHNISGDAALRTLLGNGSLTTGPHIVVLDHTVTYSGDYFGAFPLRPAGDAAPGGNNVVVFISKAIYDSMPGGSWTSTICPPKVRVTSNDLANLAFFQGSSTLGSFMVSGPTKGWRFIGLRFGLSTSAGSVSHLVSIGNGDTSVQRNNTMCPSNVGLDRCWFDAHASADTRHTCELHCANGYVIDCGWGQNIFVINYAESHGICGYNGPGPFRIINNGVVGGSQSIFFGGGASPCGMPSDIEIRYNYCTRPASWFGTGRMVKCGFEIKKAAYLIFEGNIVENVWPQSQVGYGCLLKSESYGDASVVGTTHDVLVRANIVRNVAGAVNIAGVPNVDPAIAPVRVVSFGNLYLVGGGIYNASGNPYCGAYLSTDCGSIHDTMVSVGTVNQVAAPGNATRYLLLDSIFGATTYGVKGSGMAEGTTSFTNGMPGSLTASPPTAAKSVFTARPSGSYPAGFYFPANEAAIQFTNAAAKDYSLLGTSQSGGAVPGVPPLPAAPYAASLRIRTQPAGATSAAPLLTQPVLEILDQYGNIFNSTLTITATSDSGSVSDTGNTKAAVAGVATFTALTPTAGATVATTWTFTGTGLTSVTSDSVSVVVPVASPVATALRVKTQPSGAVSSVPLTTQPEVEVIDQYDNPITSTAVITAAVVSNGPVTFTAGTTKAAVGGVASFTNLTANTTAQFHASALFTSPGLTSVQSNAFSVAVFVQPPPPPVPVPDPDPPPQDPDPEPPTPPTTEPDPVPAQLVVTRAPGPATHIYSGKVWPIQPVLEARDINGDLMTSFSGAVTVSIQSGTGTLKGTTVAYAIGGVIRFTNLALKGAPGASIVLAFTDGPIPGQDV
jgi:hypothetical protein